MAKKIICGVLISSFCLLSVTLIAQSIVQASGDIEAFDIGIDKTLFSSISVRLNTELYNISANTINREHLNRCYGTMDTALFQSYKKVVNPLVPLAMTINECGGWADRRYTWSSAIYTKPMANAGIDMDYLKVGEVNADTYVVLGMDSYMGCGSNCTAPSSIGNKHTHIVGGRNDNDSLGSLQVLRRYIEVDGFIAYACGETTADLMCWKDNVEYFFHKQSDTFANRHHWNKGHVIQNVYELVALMGVAHNTGSAFQSAGSSGYAGSLWKDAGAVYDLCSLLGNEGNVSILKSYVDRWYQSVLIKIEANEDFSLAGQVGWDCVEIKELMQEMGIVEATYVHGSSFGHKQVYPITAVLNYMSLERLYLSGGKGDGI